MKNIILFVFLLVFSIGALAYSVTAQDINNDSRKDEDFIVGMWRLDGELPKNKSGHSFHWFLEYTFSSNGTFLLTGYPPLVQKGKYRMEKRDANNITLKLFGQSGNFGTKDKQIEIIFDREKDTLDIDGKKGFKRLKKKQRS